MPLSRRYLARAAAALLALAALAPAQTPPPQDAPRPRVIVLGFDGADHAMTQDLIARGELPNLKALAERGSFTRLETTNPAESAVSWATFGCGLNPGHSNMFGFVCRKPGTYLPDATFMKIGERPLAELYDNVPAGAGAVMLLTLGGVAIGLLLGFVLARALRFHGASVLWLALGCSAAGAVAGWLGAGGGGPAVAERVPTLLRVVEGEPLWRRLDAAGVRVKGFLVPMSTPIDPLARGQMNGGLGVPDVTGSSIGRFFVFSTSRRDVPVGDERRTPSSGQVIRLAPQGDGWVAELPGPEDIARRAEVEARLADLDKLLEQSGSDAALKSERDALREEQQQGFAARLELRVRRLPEGGKVEVSLGGVTAVAAAGEWSDWLAVRFALRWPLDAAALARFCVLEAGDEIRLFFPPLGYDPRDLPRHMHIEHPPGFTRRVAADAGLFDTTGWACVTNPLKDVEIDEGVFLEQIRLLTADRTRVVLNELAKDDWDFFFTLFGELDRVQHMMYRLIDAEHPLYDAGLASKYGTAITDAYKAMDEIVGEVMRRFGDERTQILVVSDHGFTSFRRQMALNSWLIQEGYLVPIRGGNDPDVLMRRLRKNEQDLLQFMDRGKSRAFALGLGKIYINLRGREANGIVAETEYDALCAEIAQKLLALRDPLDGAPVITRVWRAQELYDGPYAAMDADLVVGFAPHYRVSWSTTLGGFSAQVIEDNDSKWSGDHASNDPDVVPGVLLSSRALASGQRPAIVDMAPTILALFGAPATGMDGVVLKFE